MNKDVIVKSTVGAIVSIAYEPRALKRVWAQKGAIQRIKFEDLQEAIYDIGIEKMFRDGILYIEDLDVKIELGLEESGAVVPEKVIVLSEAEISRALTVQPLHELKELLSTLSLAQIQEIARIAVKERVLNAEKLDLLDTYVNMNLYKTVLNMTQVDREDQLESAQAA